MEVVSENFFSSHSASRSKHRWLVLLALLFILAQASLVLHDTAHLTSEHEGYGCEICLISGGMNLINASNSIDLAFSACLLAISFTAAGVFFQPCFYCYLTRAPPLRH